MYTVYCTLIMQDHFLSTFAAFTLRAIYLAWSFAGGSFSHAIRIYVCGHCALPVGRKFCKG